MWWGPTPFVCFLTLVACLAGADPAAGAAALAHKVCYQEEEAVIFSVGGFTPGGLIDVRRDGLYVGALTAHSNGAAIGTVPAPLVDPARVRPFSIVATDRTNPLISAQIRPMPLASVFDVDVRPRDGRPNRRRRISARGFTSGTDLYVHISRRGRTRNISLGRLDQPCGVKTVRRRIFRRATRRGIYRVQFDTFRRFRASRRPRVTFLVSIVPRARRSADRAAFFGHGSQVRERWERVG